MGGVKMSETRVVHVLSQEWAETPEDQRVYIGRANRKYGFKQSKWANHFKIMRHGTRSEVVQKYGAWVMQVKYLREAIGELRGKVLGCWCKPRECHGDFLAYLADHPDGIK